MKKRILLIGSLPPPYYGSAVYFKNIVESDLRVLFDLNILDISDHRQDLNNLGKLDFWNIFHGIKNCFQLIIKLIKFKPKVVYIVPSSNNAYLREALFILLVTLFSSSKIIEHFHISDFDKFYKNSCPLIQKVIDYSQRKVYSVIVLGENLKAMLLPWFKIDRIYVIPNGIIDEVGDVEVSSNRNGNKILFVSNYYKFKGVFQIISIAKHLIKVFPDIVIEMIGDWGNDYFYDLEADVIKADFLNQVKINHLGKNIFILGPKYNEDKNIYFKDSDIFLLPTENDTFPMVILEAMMWSLPVVSSENIGAISEIIDDGKTGFVIRSGEDVKFADKLIYILDNKNLRLSMGKEGRKKFIAKYKLDNNINLLRKLFDEI